LTGATEEPISVHLVSCHVCAYWLYPRRLSIVHFSVIGLFLWRGSVDQIDACIIWIEKTNKTQNW